MRSIWSFIGLIHRHWIAALAGWLSFLAWALGAFWWDWSPSIIFIAVTVVAYCYATYRVWREEYAKRLDLEERLKPKIKVFLEGNGIHERQISLGQQTIAAYGLSKWAQISVQSATECRLEGCEVVVTKVAKIDAGQETILLDEAALCKWSDDQDNLTRFDIPAGTSKRANLLMRRADLPQSPRLEFLNAKIDTAAITNTPGTYRIDVVVSAKDPVPPVRRSFILEWGLAFQDMSLTELAQ